MKLVRLEVERFQCIASAELAFGPGLNVLYGPNDLGKSSLAWAIRAVLLLQHSSKEHERFVSWYGGGAPRVALTLTDDEGRYWRITKSFAGGAAGRSNLESSKDGRTFRLEAEGRQVDDKIRGLLRWGLNRAGGGQGQRGFPQSFLTHVLLSEQDDVRKVLFDSSLTDDADESGRLRLNEALGALAQDPLFKRVLDQAQERVDEAFTPGGKKSKKAGSPFIELGKQIGELQTERDDLDQRVRDSAATEAKIGELLVEREQLSQALDEARAAHRVKRVQLDARLEHDKVASTLRTHREAIDAAALLERDLATLQLRIATGTQELAALDSIVRAEADALAAASALRDAAQLRVDDVLRQDPAATAARRVLEEQHRTANEQLVAARRDVERAEEAERRARRVAQDVASAQTDLAHAAGLTHAAEAALAASEDALTAVARQLDEAKLRVRDLSSGDQAQARALAKQTLETKRLDLHRQQVEQTARLASANAAEQAAAGARQARVDQTNAEAQLAQAQGTLAAAQGRIADLDATLNDLTSLERYGALDAARTALAHAQREAAAASDERDAARALRTQAETLLARVRAGLPSRHEITELRTLFDSVTNAEAQLGALTVAIQPLQALSLQVSRDGAPAEAHTAAAATTLEATHSLVVEITGVGTIEIVSGAAAARARADELRSQWNQTGAAVLKAHGVATLDALARLRDDSERSTADAAGASREADRLEQRAGERTSGLDLGASERREADAALALHGIALASLAERFAAMGPTWADVATKQRRSLDADRAREAAALEQQRTLVARLDGELLAQSRETARLEELERTTQAALAPETWSSVAAASTLALSTCDRDLAEVDQHLSSLVAGTSDEEAVACARAAALEEAVSTAARERDAWRVHAAASRSAADKADARLESLRATARELDTFGAWVAALETASAILAVDAWTADTARHTERALQLTAQCTSLGEQLAASAAAQAELVSIARREANTARETHATAQAAAAKTADARTQAAGTLDQLRVAETEFRVKRAGLDLDAARAAIPALETAMRALAAQMEDTTDEDVRRCAERETRVAEQLRAVEDDLAKAKGALEHVGGAVVRERMRELDQALTLLRSRERDLDVEYDAWKLLRETLQASEASEGQHLGRTLAGPVSRRFQELTGGRYGQFELGPHVEAEGLQVAGERREIMTLSAGTQDQLATLLRLCIAEQLQTSIVLDDHLSQSDLGRISHFNQVIRAAAQNIQVVFITCRPGELLGPDEFPAAGDASRSGAAGLVYATDLTKVIRRYPTAQGA